MFKSSVDTTKAPNDSNTIQRVANKAHSLEETTKKGRSSLLEIYNIPNTGSFCRAQELIFFYGFSLSNLEKIFFKVSLLLLICNY